MTATTGVCFFSKLVLPKLGGAPGVWSVAIVFLQSVLLPGDTYAYLPSRHENGSRKHPASA